MRHIVLSVCWLLLLSGCAATMGGNDHSPVAPYSLPSNSPYPTLKQRIDTLVHDRLLPQSSAAIKIVSLKTGEIIYQYNPLLLMTPASNQKLFTAAAALTTLGGEHPLETTVFLDGEELYLKGGGDSLLTTVELRQLAETVSGSILPGKSYRLTGDVSCFDDLYWGKGWMWDDEPEPDEMYISPLSVNGNAITVEVTPADTPGKPALAKLIPATEFMTIRNRATTAKKGTPAQLVIKRRPGDRENLVTVEGTIPLDSPTVAQRMSVWQPERYALALFRDLLRSHGIAVSEIGFGITPAEAKPLAVRTRSVGQLLSYILKKSDNLSAESLLKLMGREATHRPGSAENGVKVVRRYLAERGISTVNEVIVDGSGLSRYNLTTPRTIIRLLEEMYRDPVNYPLFLRSLAMAGRDGTLAYRMRATPAEGKVMAKSGTMNGISTLSGYLTTSTGEPLAFSILIQNYAGAATTAMEVQDRICILLSGFRQEE